MMKCIEWFSNIITKGDIDDFNTEFRIYAEKLDGYFMPYPNGINDGRKFYVDIGDIEDNVVRTYTLDNFIKKRIEEELWNSVLCISDETNGLTLVEKHKILAKVEAKVKDLNFVLDKRDSKPFTQGIKEGLETLVNYCRKDLDLRLTEDSPFNFLLNIVDLKELDQTLEKLEFYNPYGNQVGTFWELLSPSPSSTMVEDLQIQVFCDNYAAAYILRKIEPLFSNLTFTSIDNSKAILKKQGRPFKKTDLYKALNIFYQKADKDPSIRNKIDEALSQFLAKGKI